MTLEVTSVNKCQKTTADPTLLPTYDLTTGRLSLPSVQVRFPTGQWQYYYARLKKIQTRPMQLRLSLAEPAAGERYAVGNTNYVNTLIGYGEKRVKDSYPAYLRSDAAGGDILWGTDLGLPLTLPGASSGEQDLTLYLFGDTDQLDLALLHKPDKVVQKYAPNPELINSDFFYGPKGPLEGDAIGLSIDDDPSDGIHLFHVYRNQEGTLPQMCEQADPDGFRPVYLDGIHAETETILDRLRDELKDLKLPEEKIYDLLNNLPAPACLQKYPNTTPTGAWAVNDILFMVAGIQNEEKPASAKSYLAVSTDLGLHWQVVNDKQPFSKGGLQPAKFIHAFGIEVDAYDYQDMKRSGPCGLPLPEGEDTRGLLLFGSGWWKESNVYLAFVSRTDLLKAASDDQHRLTPWYFAGTDHTSGGKRCWSTSEADAKAIIAAGDLASYARFEDACGTKLTSAGVGYPKAIHVNETLADGTRIDRLVMLLSPAYKGKMRDNKTLDADLGTVLVTGDPWRPWIWNVAVTPDRHNGRLPTVHRFRPLPVPPAPNRGLLPTYPRCRNSGVSWATVSGYAPLLIDRYTHVSEDGQGVDLYFVISRSNVPSGPNDDGPETVDAYHYVVDVMRTTLRPIP